MARYCDEQAVACGELEVEEVGEVGQEWAGIVVFRRRKIHECRVRKNM
jgi:hypothetical protein